MLTNTDRPNILFAIFQCADGTAGLGKTFNQCEVLSATFCSEPNLKKKTERSKFLRSEFDTPNSKIQLHSELISFT